MVSGCDALSRFVCAHPYDPNANGGQGGVWPWFTCTGQRRIAVVATDGGVHEAWEDDPSAATAAAALASAARDLPCAPGQIGVVAAGRILEGCGQRVTYEVVEGRFSLLGRIAITPPGSASP